jgi:hypothetical protein
MKISKLIFSILLSVIFLQSVKGQAVFAFTDIVFTHTNSESSQWEVWDNNGNQFNNGDVATLRAPGSSNLLNFGQQYNSFGTAVIRFKTCLAVGRNFTVVWHTSNVFGWNVGNGSFQVSVFPPPAEQLAP